MAGRGETAEGASREDRVRPVAMRAGVTMSSSLVVAFAVLFVLDAAPVLAGGVDAETGRLDARWVGYSALVAGYLLLAVGTVVGAVAVAASLRRPVRLFVSAAVVVLAGVAAVAVGASAVVGSVDVGSGAATFAFLSVGVPPALLVVAYLVAARRRLREGASPSADAASGVEGVG